MAEGDLVTDESTSRYVRGYYGTTPKICEQMVEHSLKWNPVVKFMRDALEKAGCPVGPTFIRTQKCDMEVGGGFVPGEGVVVCSNYVQYQAEVDVIIAHELVHALDHCRAANLDWSDCRHHACSEIRASNLSGACVMGKELLTRPMDFKLRAGYQACVRRKAQLSVAMNPACVGKEKEAVEAAWECCYRDTTPFDRAP